MPRDAGALLFERGAELDRGWTACERPLLGLEPRERTAPELERRSLGLSLGPDDGAFAPERSVPRWPRNICALVTSRAV
jgi:hypothetical protein